MRKKTGYDFRQQDILRWFKRQEFNKIAINKLDWFMASGDTITQRNIFDSWERHFRGESFPGFKLKFNVPHVIVKDRITGEEVIFKEMI